MPHHKRQITVLITAGHAATTALATIEAMKDDPDHEWSISWIGPKVALEGTNLVPFELDLFPKLGVSVYSITAGKLQSKFTRHTIPALLKIPVGFGGSLSLLLKIKPDVVLSFGGYAAVPVVAAASLMRIPIVLHEQTVAAGLANKVTGLFATKIALAREESLSFFQKNKCVVVGNPLLKEVVTTTAQHALPKVPTIYVTGGSRGAQRVNNPIFDILPDLLHRYCVIHQTGTLDEAKALEVKSKLPEAIQDRYEVHAFINPLEIGEIYKRASLVIGRAGANTVSEVMALGIPSIFIPIPWSRADEQTKNALKAESAGVARLIPESELNNSSLLETVEEVFSKWKNMQAAAQRYRETNKDVKAAASLCQLVSHVLK